MKRVLSSREAGLGLILLVLGAAMSYLNPAFLSVGNLLDLLKSNVVLALLAIGSTVVIISGGIDISVGALTACVTLFLGEYIVQYGFDLPIALVVSVLFGACLGLINGSLIAFTTIPPIVITLGTMSVFNGAIMLHTGGAWIGLNDVPRFVAFGTSQLVKFQVDGRPSGLAIQVAFLILVALITTILLRRTWLGRHIYAIGGNLEAAERTGIQTRKVFLFVYAYMGAVGGVAALVHTSLMRQVDPKAFVGFELMVIAAVVLGGTNIFGGSGTVIGTLLGVALLAALRNGLMLARVSSYWHEVIVGAAIVWSMAVGVLLEKRKQGVFRRRAFASSVPDNEPEAGS